MMPPEASLGHPRSHPGHSLAPQRGRKEGERSASRQCSLFPPVSHHGQDRAAPRRHTRALCQPWGPAGGLCSPPGGCPEPPLCLWPGSGDRVVAQGAAGSGHAGRLGTRQRPGQAEMLPRGAALLRRIQHRASLAPKAESPLPQQGQGRGPFLQPPPRRVLPWELTAGMGPDPSPPALPSLPAHGTGA